MLFSAIALSAIALPLSGQADHPAYVAHIEHDHGGHGTVLLDQDERLLSKTFEFSAVTVEMTTTAIEPATSGEFSAHRTSFAHLGRDPPDESRPRAPPTLTS